MTLNSDAAWALGRMTEFQFTPSFLPSLPIDIMASSLSPECTPLKANYDACFNSWFEGYLEPAMSAGTDRTEYSKRKAEEYQQKCGKVWEEYKACVQVR